MKTWSPAGEKDVAIVYVVDDDHSVRSALEDLFASIGLQVRSFASTKDFMNSTLENAPACLILDVRMPGQSGMDFHRQMADLGIRLPVVFITGHGDIAMGVKAIKNGAVEFLTKPFHDQVLIDAIQDGIEKDRARRQRDSIQQELNQRWSALTKGEQEVSRLVVRGLLNKQIAAQLNVSEITVKVRRAHAMRKMQAMTLADLVRLVEKTAS